MENIKGTQTEKNLQTAFAGESQARNKYTYFAAKAKKEGFVQIANIVEETANNEKEHAKIWFKLLCGGDIPATPENLGAAAAGEKSLPVFLRELALHEGTVVAALSADERKSITDLGKIGTNIWQIRKDLINYGLDEKAASDIEAMYDEFAKIKEHFKAKLQK